MQTCILDGSLLYEPTAVYRRLGEAFGFPAYFGNNPDALWDALGDYAGEPIRVVWRDAARSAQLLGPQFAAIVGVLEKAAERGVLKLELS